MSPGESSGERSGLSCEAIVVDRGLDLAFAVAKGETLALLGPNGAGKSTVLSVVAGLLHPDRGRVRLDGQTLTAVGDPASGSPRVQVPPHRRRVALLAQDPLLFPHLDVRDNVAFGPRATGQTRAESRRRAERWLAELGIEALADRRATQLSGGQAQRVAVARALAAEPQLLLLDEPLAAIDVALAPALRQTLRRVLAGRTAVLVTHDVLDALLLADRVLVLDRGREVESGPAAAVLTRPRSEFGARIAGLDLVAGTWRDGHVVATSPAGRQIAGDVPEGVPRDGDPVVAVFRPTAVSVHLHPPGGSPRNVLPVTVTEIEPHGHLVRLRAGDLSADVTPQAVAELELVPGLDVHFVVKATEVAVYPR